MFFICAHSHVQIDLGFAPASHHALEKFQCWQHVARCSPAHSSYHWPLKEPHEKDRLQVHVGLMKRLPESGPTCYAGHTNQIAKLP